MNMKIHNGMLIAAAIVCSIFVMPAFAKTAKECTEEWRADKAGMQARGVKEKVYVEQCKGGAEPTAAAPAAKPTATTPRQTTATGSKTAKDCTVEWRADKAGMQARGVTEKAYVEQCKGGLRPLQHRHRQPAHRLRRKLRRNASPSGEPTSRACKPVA
jgi:hypothetical protein